MCLSLADKYTTISSVEQQGFSHTYSPQLVAGGIGISENSAYSLTSVVALAKICLDKSWYPFVEEELTEIVNPWVNLQLMLLEGRGV